MQIVEVKITDIRPYEKNPRVNDKAVDAVATSIREFGFKVPLVLDTENVIIAGHTRFKAAKKLGLETVPVLYADDLNEEQVRAFRIADNKVAEAATWDEALLADELGMISNIDMAQLGFDKQELNRLLNPEAEAVEDDFDVDGELQKPAVTLRGDIIHLGPHRMMCGDSTDI